MKHPGVFANMKALVVLVACLHVQEELKKKKICSVCRQTPLSPGAGREADEGLPTGQKIRDREIGDQDEKLPVRTDLPWQSLAGVAAWF